MTNPAVVGIDLGTTFSLAAYVENGRPLAGWTVTVCRNFKCFVLPRSNSLY